MITDHGLWGAPLRQRLSKDLHDPAEILPLAAARPHARATVAIQNQRTIEPVPGNLDEIPEIDKPGLMWGGRRLGTFRWIGDPGLPRWARMRLFVECHHLPHGSMAIAIA